MSMNFLIFLLSIFLIQNCELPEPIKNWQKKQVEKRYGKVAEEDKIPKWQEEILEYEAQINKKIEAGYKAALVYRKLGESFGLMESWDQCVINTDKAIKLGQNSAKVFYTRAICLAREARLHNWDFDKTMLAERGFLKVLTIDPSFQEAKTELGLLYYYGLGQSNRYAVNNETIYLSKGSFRKQGINLLEKVVAGRPSFSRPYFALAGIWKIEGETNSAIETTKGLINMLKKEFPNDYTKLPEYKKAIENLQILRLN